MSGDINNLQQGKILIEINKFYRDEILLFRKFRYTRYTTHDYKDYYH